MRLCGSERRVQAITTGASDLQTTCEAMDALALEVTVDHGTL